MLSRLCALRCAPTVARECQRNFSFPPTLLSRYPRRNLRQQLYKQKEALRNASKIEVNTEQLADSIPLRPPRHLWIALGFTGVSAFAIFYAAVYADVDRSYRERQKPFHETFFTDFKRLMQHTDIKGVTHSDKEIFRMEMERAETCVLAITALNVFVTLAWKLKPLQPQMWRYFTNSFASKSLCPPMLLSVFSHKSAVHLALNMYVLWSFAPAAINRYLGVEQFWAFYLTGGIAASLVSIVHKSAIGCTGRALGASGAILALLIFVCARMPDARLRIIFLPFFDFSAETAIYGIILFDLIGLVLGYRLFDHAAHLGGALFGLFYAKYGENWYRRSRAALLQVYKEVIVEEKKRQKRPHKPN